MKTTTYIITGGAGANLRDLPSTSGGALAVHLPKGAKITVVDDFTAVNGVGETTKYLCVRYNGRYLWMVSTLAEPYVSTHINYLERAARAAAKVYGTITRLKCRHKSGSTSLDDIQKNRFTNCAAAASAVLQEAGCLPKGKLVNHTAAVRSDILKRKNTLEKAVKGAEHLREGTCVVVRVGKKFSELPTAFQKAGTVYVQDSNICVSAGGGWIWSANEASNQMSKGKGYYTMVKNASGYTHNSPILYVIAPKN